MAFDLSSISMAAQELPPRIVLLGVEKIGKTSFACGSRIENGVVAEYGLNKPVLIPVSGEEGADSIPVAKFPVATGMDDVIEGISALHGDGHQFETVVIDSISTLYNRVKDGIIRNPKYGIKDVKEFDHFGAGASIASPIFENMLAGLTSLRSAKGMRSILIGHAKTKTVSSPDADPYEAWIWDINSTIANLIYRWADLILFAKAPEPIAKLDGKSFGNEHKRAVELKPDDRLLCTHKSAKQPGGGRGIYGRLPAVLPLDWASFQEAVNNINM